MVGPHNRHRVCFSSAALTLVAQLRTFAELRDLHPLTPGPSPSVAGEGRVGSSFSCPRPFGGEGGPATQGRVRGSVGHPMVQDSTEDSGVE